MEIVDIPEGFERVREEPISVWIDGIIFSLQSQGGISVYCRQMLERLSRDGVRGMLALDGYQDRHVPTSGEAFKSVQRPARKFERYRDCRISDKQGETVFHSMYYRCPTSRSVPTVVTVYDFVYERFSSGPRKWLHSAQKCAAIRRAQAIICISKSTLDDLHEYVGVAPNQIAHVVHLGASEQFRPIDTRTFGQKKVLFVGKRSGYKNFSVALKAMEHLPDVELHCVGGTPLQEYELRAVPGEVRRRVKHLGLVSDEELNRLYNEAICLVYPSRYEGFGIPVVEAMRAGCPVVSVSCSAVMEVGGDALVVSEDHDLAVAACIERLMDETFRASRVKRGFAVAAQYSWEKCYRSTLDVYRQIVV